MKMRRPELRLHVPHGMQYPCTIGKYCYAAEPPKIYFYGGIDCTLTIGSFVSIGPDVTVIVGGEHRKEWISTYPFSEMFEGIQQTEYVQTKGHIVIGSDVWIGAKVTILSGVTIGDGAIIGAGSVVTKDVEPYTIAAGNPIQMIRKRFDDATIQKLLALRWWHLTDDEIERIAPILMSNNVDALGDMYAKQTV